MVLVYIVDTSLEFVVVAYILEFAMVTMPHGPPEQGAAVFVLDIDINVCLAQE